MTRSSEKKAYVWRCLAVMLLAQAGVYYVTRLLLANAPLHDLSTALDHRIPFVPVWVTVYFLAYAFWIVNAVWILSEGRERAYRITGAYVMAALLAGAMFLLYPGTIARPEVTGNGFFEAWVRLLYRIDEPNNLCPSMHVLASYFCWRGTWGCRRIPGWHKGASFCWLVLVCLSILFVKQHALVDIPAAVIVAEISLYAVRRRH